jgi:hypothetical protein
MTFLMKHSMRVTKLVLCGLGILLGGGLMLWGIMLFAFTVYRMVQRF